MSCTSTINPTYNHTLISKPMLLSAADCHDVKGLPYKQDCLSRKIQI